MDSLCCKDCRQLSSVTSYSRTIRCRGCQRTISCSNDKPEDINSSGRSKCLPFHRKISTSPSYGSLSHSLMGSFHPPPRGKRALLCGVSYKANKFKIKGAAQDVMNMRNLLARKFGFPDNAFLILGESEQNLAPTRSNILEAFKWLTTDLQRDDSLVFYFSGHGLRQLEFEEDELDGFDEAICPVDFETAGMIIDNEINQMIVAPLIEGVTLHAIIDTCHSGTLLDLPYIYNRNNQTWDTPRRVCKGTSGGQAICISACEDYQLATDTSIFSPDRTMSGAMTHTFIQAVQSKEKLTYRNILDSVSKGIAEANKYISRGIRRLFHRQMLQDAILSSSEPFSIDSVFTL